MGCAYIGISGYDYAGWRGTFYPPDVPRREWLAFTSRIYNSVELNGTFYSLKSPSVFARWASAVPDDGFVFAIKGGRFITHNLKLRNCDAALGNFFASGVLALGEKTGPFLWQLPASYRFDAERMDTFMRMLPRDSIQGEVVARQHDHRLRRGALIDGARAASLSPCLRGATSVVLLRRVLRASARARLRVRDRRYRGQVRLRGGGDRRLRVRAVARIERALRERLHRRGARRMGRQDQELDSARATCTSTSTTMRKYMRRTTRCSSELSSRTP